MKFDPEEVIELRRIFALSKRRKPSTEFEQFDSAMDTILKADPKAVKEAMKTEKKANAEKRKTKKSFASGHASNEKD